MARLSSASTESDYVPAMVPFVWEAAPGRPARESTTSAFKKSIADVEREIIDVPSLPLPPGRRPKDGFYLPFSRPAEFPHVHDEAGGSNRASSREKRPFGSRVTRRVLVEFQKSRSCLRGCSSHGRKNSSSHNHIGRRLDSMNEEDSNEEEASEPPLPASSRHGHGRTRNAAVPGARKQSQVPSSRLMASMLISLCPAESDEAEAVDAEDEVTHDCGDELRSSGQLTMPRARVSSPEAIFQAPQQGIVVDPVTSHEEWARAWVDMSTDMSTCMPESLHKEPAIANLCEYCRSREAPTAKN